MKFLGRLMPAIISAGIAALKAGAAFFSWKNNKDLMEAGAAQAKAEGQDELLEDIVEDKKRDAVIDSDPSVRRGLLRRFGGPKE